jgi:hypothetical protein
LSKLRQTASSSMSRMSARCATSSYPSFIRARCSRSAFWIASRITSGVAPLSGYATYQELEPLFGLREYQTAPVFDAKRRGCQYRENVCSTECAPLVRGCGGNNQTQVGESQYPSSKELSPMFHARPLLEEPGHTRSDEHEMPHTANHDH